MPGILPITRPRIAIEIEAETLEERTTVVHCRLTIACLLRISPQTWLQQEDGRRCALVGAYGIVQAPAWDFVNPEHSFTLIFEGLSRNCLRFDLIEQIDEPYPFHFTGIARNGTDVYHLEYPNFPLG